MKKTIVLGVGNLLLKDEGIGVHVVQEILKNHPVPEHVEVIDGGTAALDLIHVICEANRLIVIDALRAGNEPGTLYRLKPGDFTMAQDHGVSLHQTNLVETLGMAAKLGYHPDTVIIGVEPGEITWGTDLSPEIEAKIPKIIELVFREINAGVNKDVLQP